MIRGIIQILNIPPDSHFHFPIFDIGKASQSAKRRHGWNQNLTETSKTSILSKYTFQVYFPSILSRKSRNSRKSSKFSEILEILGNSRNSRKSLEILENLEILGNSRKFSEIPKILGISRNFVKFSDLRKSHLFDEILCKIEIEMWGLRRGK